MLHRQRRRRCRLGSTRAQQPQGISRFPAAAGSNLACGVWRRAVARAWHKQCGRSSRKSSRGAEQERQWSQRHSGSEAWRRREDRRRAAAWHKQCGRGSSRGAQQQRQWSL